MAVTLQSENPPWLLLVFSLPSNRASQRVEVWRKLQRAGALALRSSGYVLPNSAGNQEKLEWLAAAIRSYKGQASVAQVQGFDDLPHKRLQQLFLEARGHDYERLMGELKRIVTLPVARRPAGRLSRLRKRLQEVIALDFFHSPLRSKVEALLARADEPEPANLARRGKGKSQQYAKRTWITRPRPGIDRVSSAWLIRRFVDSQARFVFGDEPGSHPEAIPFDMFNAQGFGHRGEDCTFETLCKEFAIRDGKVKRIAQIIHDADLGDEKFGRPEGEGIDRVLDGWAAQDISDDELLQRGMDLVEGLYYGMP
jgi:hypothetical protein